MKMPTEPEMRAAVEARDEAFDGCFLYGVITTGVFCRPSCKSRPARPENLRFFPDVPAAMSAGFRPCRRCRPGGGDSALARLVEVARYIEAHAEDRLTLNLLAERVDLSVSRLQRAFKGAFGVSPRVYQDAVRMRRFRLALQQGDKVTGALFEAGFGSMSRIYGQQTRSIGMTPGAYRSGGAGEQIAYACRETGLGPMLMAATARGVCFVQFGGDEAKLLERLRAEFPKAEISPSDARNSPQLDLWVEALDAHISDGTPRPDLPLDLRGTAFQVMVWHFLLSVREGEVLSYSELAARIGRPKAVRAVASACAANHVGVLVPCHRVLRSDGSLGGYRWGLERKRALLEAERANNIGHGTTAKDGS